MSCSLLFFLILAYSLNPSQRQPPSKLDLWKVGITSTAAAHSSSVPCSAHHQLASLTPLRSSGTVALSKHPQLQPRPDGSSSLRIKPSQRTSSRSSRFVQSNPTVMVSKPES